jgi:DMSO/TMAO reductase YedYZ molybdopterin-dependent catalytic subunit
VPSERRNRHVDCMPLHLPSGLKHWQSGPMMSRGAALLARVTTVLAASALLGAGSAAVSHADGPSLPDAATVAVTGDVHNPTTWTLDALRALPPHTQAVTFGTDAGPQSRTYVGAALTDIVAAADPNVDTADKHPLLPLTILAIGSDGYSAAVSWGEIAPELAATPVLVAYTQDGQPLEEARLVIPGDIEGARYVSGLTELRIVDVRHP